ncbi:MAG: DNA-processing protein DprA [Cytophagales bacterium]|nr:DNA-processing protein DprA [Cytophagales bacterium]
MDQDRLSFLALHFVPGVGDFLIRQLISYCGSAEEVFRQTRARLLRIPGVGEITTESIRQGTPFRQAEEAAKRAEAAGIQLLFYTDPAFPDRLKSIADAPTLLYVQGHMNLNVPRTVGIVGTRKSTPYGRKCVEAIVEEMVSLQPVIISGLAYGIDIHAHRQALKHNLPTVGILGSGLDNIYPAVHLETARKMTDSGALITENHFGTKPDAHNFPERNRIIAGMCDAVIVVEAAERGGALITAEIANSYNKDVFAVPGNIDSTYSAGCNKLIKINKAHLLTTAKDLEYIMNWGTQPATPPSQLTLSLDSLEPAEQTIIRVLRERKDPVPIDELCVLSGFTQGFLASHLLSLEFKNLVVSLPGKRYQER